MSADCPPGFRLEDGKCVPDIKDRGTPVQCPECFGEAGVDPGDCRWCGGFAAGRAEADAKWQKRIDEAPKIRVLKSYFHDGDWQWTTHLDGCPCGNCELFSLVPVETSGSAEKEQHNG